MDHFDTYLKKRLKNWAAFQKPPVNGKMRLLQTINVETPPVIRGGWIKERYARRANHGSDYRHFPDSINSNSDWPILFIFEVSMSNLRLMY